MKRPIPDLRTPNRWRRPAAARGFTLIEAALTTVIVGTGVLAMVAAQQAYHQKNQWAQRSAQGLLLANELRELIMTLPLHDPIDGPAHMGPETGETGIADYDDVDDFAGPVAAGFGAGVSFTPPVNALRQNIADLDGWMQKVTVINVLPDNISITDALAQPLGATALMRVSVSTTYQGPHDENPMTIANLTWVISDE
jgi:hypothetical protein